MITKEMYVLAKKVVESYEKQQLNIPVVIKRLSRHEKYVKQKIMSKELDKAKEIKNDKYILLMYYIHSELELIKDKLEFDSNTTVENFQHRQVNKNICSQIFKNTLEYFDYELSHNQMCNGINRFLESQKQLNNI